MPIQYYDTDWFNNRPPHARAKLAAQRIVAFVPNSPDFLSGRADDGLTIKALTDKYGPEVFKNYDLDYRTGGEDSGGDGEKSGANTGDDSGESVGSRDSNDEESDADGESSDSSISDDEGAMDKDGDAYGSEDMARNTTSFATSYDMDLEAEIFDAPSSSSDESAVISTLPSSVPAAQNGDLISTFAVDPTTPILPGQDAWEDVIHGLFNCLLLNGAHHKNTVELSGVIRRGPLGMNGFFSWLEICFNQLHISPAMVENRVERIIQAMMLLGSTVSPPSPPTPTNSVARKDTPATVTTIAILGCPGQELLTDFPGVSNSVTRLLFAPKNANAIHSSLGSAVQSKLPVGAALAPVIIATDKTQLTQFSGGKSAYPVYLTLGNIPKSLRRKPSQSACILIGYLSVDKIIRKQLSQQSVKMRNQKLFHASMRVILQPLIAAGNQGMEVVGGDGQVRLVFPILASYVADYPEQCLVGCSKYGTCPKCQCSANDLQDPTPAAPRTPAWTLGVIREGETSGTENKFHDHCMDNEVAGIHRPFWEGFPLTNISLSLTPDVLHQLYQGVFKHLVGWCQTLMTEAELDARIRSLPPAFGVRHFDKGISLLSQISGGERKAMARILLGCLVGKLPAKGIRACRAILDFIYLSQYSTHDDGTLSSMRAALDVYHTDRDYFITSTIRKDFNIPKFHSLLHYVESIEYFGTTDNYNTEMFERLHIDFAKNGWRASNHRDAFPQMITWLGRQEKVSSFSTYLAWLDSKRNPIRAPLVRTFTGQAIQLAKKPQSPRQLLTSIELHHHTDSFIHTLKEFLNHTSIPAAQLLVAALPFTRLDVYHNFKFEPNSLDPGAGPDENNPEDFQTVLARPQSADRATPPRFDTVILYIDVDGGLHRP
ncbi:hypothetical protein B0H10DRAFT_2242974 [Mycena sp. CBHHK59/15]|nr:hypothetical protein B0H10DRAFT_2242974 [Mycena sp. CBHHK59/15]